MAEFTKGDGHEGRWVIYLDGLRFDHNVCQRVMDILHPWNPLITNRRPAFMRPGDYLTVIDGPLYWYERMAGTRILGTSVGVNITNVIHPRLQPTAIYVNEELATPDILPWVTAHETAHVLCGSMHVDRPGNILFGNGERIDEDQLREGNRAVGVWVEWQLTDYYGRDTGSYHYGRPGPHRR